MEVVLTVLGELSEVPMSDADVVLRQIVVSVGGVTAGAALLYAIYNVRARVPHAWVIARMLVALAILAVLTTEHIYSHLLADDAPVWQLWGALIGFTLGAESLIFRIRHREVTVVRPEPE